MGNFSWNRFPIKICWSIPCLHQSWKVHTCITLRLSQTLSQGRFTSKWLLSFKVETWKFTKNKLLKLVDWMKADFLFAALIWKELFRKRSAWERHILWMILWKQGDYKFKYWNLVVIFLPYQNFWLRFWLRCTWICRSFISAANLMHVFCLAPNLHSLSVCLIKSLLFHEVLTVQRFRFRHSCSWVLSIKNSATFSLVKTSWVLLP